VPLETKVLDTVLAQVYSESCTQKFEYKNRNKMIHLNFPRLSPRRWLSFSAAGLLLLGSGAYWVWISSPKSKTTPAITSPARPSAISALGRLEPRGEVINVFAPTGIDAARVERLQVQLGQQLQPGTIIAELDTYGRRLAALREAQAQVTIAQAQVRQVEAGAKAGQILAQQRQILRLRAEQETEIAAQQATIRRFKAELANAALEARRYEFLWREGAIAASLRDSKQLTVDTLNQQIVEAEAALQRIREARQQQIAEAQATLTAIAEIRPVDVQVAQSRLVQAQANLARVQAELDLAVVRAPQAGQVLKIHNRPGELVGNQGIISLGQTQQMVAVAEVYETDIAYVRVGQSAQITSKNNAFTDKLRGQVMEVGLEINKQDVLNTDPAAQFDARVVEVRVLLDPASSRKVAGLTNLSLQVVINVEP
jgi:HlyD family secretion protein